MAFPRHKAFLLCLAMSDSAVRRSVSDLLREAANRLEELERSSSSSISGVEPEEGQRSNVPSAARPGTASHSSMGRHPVDAEVLRLFAPYTRQAGGAMGWSRQPRRANNQQTSSASAPSHTPRFTYTHTFCALARKDCAVVPTRAEKERLLRAGLGERRLCFRGDLHSPQQFTEFVYINYPKLRDAGGFEFMRICGNTRSRQLSLLPCPDQGYTAQYLKDPVLLIHQTTLYIRPLQCNVSTEQEIIGRPSEIGPSTPCLLCGEEFPFSHIREHNRTCERELQGDRTQNRERESGTGTASASASASTSHDPGLDVNEGAASATENPPTEATIDARGIAPGPGIPPTEVTTDSWVTQLDPEKAAQLFTQAALEKNQHMEPLTFTLSLMDSEEERHRAIISIYKRPRVEWARPLTCRLIGDSAIGEGVTRHVLSTVMGAVQSGFLLDEKKGKMLLFEGESDHLIPSTSRELLEGDLFVTAGRMVGHSFLNGGPCLTGLSTAIIHVLFGGSPEMATISLSDCVDQDVRDVLALLEGTKDLSEEDKSQILSVTLPWDLPGVTMNNRWWLREKILIHAVLGRTTQQVKQIRRGLKDTGVWEFFSSRPDAVEVLFPRACNAEITPQMILDNINWPRDEDIDEDIVSLEDHCRIMTFLRKFIEDGTPEVLKTLLTFWTGWGVVSSNLEVEIIDCALPQSSTCFLTLKLSKNTMNYEDFVHDLMASISSSYSGFGQI
ncbi:uncharacterized protein LOC110366477 isoform X4 [Fundulus heteroclitus]|uniref:uncharacterized protein LOC110366477 isoform X4 n=1 Tax=Fundulus heteroclitus TaxID=8078 RepID=UPI00165B081C|nr:uncharacterized protein LOC110366477 isoform X4 [Fundulus heteroclitus]